MKQFCAGLNLVDRPALNYVPGFRHVRMVEALSSRALLIRLTKLPKPRRIWGKQVYTGSGLYEL